MSGDGDYTRFIRDRCRAVGFWKCNEASGNAIDYSIYGANASGAYTGTITREHRMHPLGTKIARHHEGQCTITDSSLYTIGANGLTVITWQYLEGTGDGDQYTVTKRNTSNHEWALSFQNATTTPSYQMNMFVTATAANRAVTNGVASPDPRSKWTMIWGIVRDGVAIQAGINDGPSSQFTSFSGTYADGTASVVIGNTGDNVAGTQFTGNIGYVSIHPYAMDRNDIVKAYKLGIGRRSLKLRVTPR